MDCIVVFSLTNRLEENVTSPLTDNISSIITLLFVYNVSFIDNVEDNNTFDPIDKDPLIIRLLFKYTLSFIDKTDSIRTLLLINNVSEKIALLPTDNDDKTVWLDTYKLLLTTKLLWIYVFKLTLNTSLFIIILGVFGLFAKNDKVLSSLTNSAVINVSLSVSITLPNPIHSLSLLKISTLPELELKNILPTCVVSWAWCGRSLLVPNGIVNVFPFTYKFSFT